ncbi:uncharacterized protein LOC116344793 [Contarinia nasturtii]|uniref:uncharacterized protein LOC116344793 n=1 Tax=Contarinia nasturtii TaxID=265458 RepID=UPI0012D37929|nr:uncharacterized protein LOC116344793 [Contarinia nasturtii]
MEEDKSKSNSKILWMKKFCAPIAMYISPLIFFILLEYKNVGTYLQDALAILWMASTCIAAYLLFIAFLYFEVRSVRSKQCLNILLFSLCTIVVALSILISIKLLRNIKSNVSWFWLLSAMLVCITIIHLLTNLFIHMNLIFDEIFKRKQNRFRWIAKMRPFLESVNFIASLLLIYVVGFFQYFFDVLMFYTNLMVFVHCILKKTQFPAIRDQFSIRIKSKLIEFTTNGIKLNFMTITIVSFLKTYTPLICMAFIYQTSSSFHRASFEFKFHMNNENFNPYLLIPFYLYINDIFLPAYELFLVDKCFEPVQLQLKENETVTVTAKNFKIILHKPIQQKPRLYMYFYSIFVRHFKFFGFILLSKFMYYSFVWSEESD